MVKALGWWACVLTLAFGSFLCAGDGRAQAQDGAAVPNPPPPALAFPAERRISLKHHWTGEELSVVYRIGDAYQPEALAAISRLLRDYRCNKIVPIDPTLIDLVYELSSSLRPRGPVRVISGYRSEGYNASLLRAGRTVDPDSQHTLGHAVDVIFPGVKADTVRAAAGARNLGGVGYYPFSGPVFVHLDTGPVRQWVERDPKERRTLGVARRRSRVALDCSLTISKVLEEVPPALAYAALPPGASTRPHVDIESRPAAPVEMSSQGPLAGDHAESGAMAGLDQSEGPACQANDPLASLSLLPSPTHRQRMVKAAPPRKAAKAKRARHRFAPLVSLTLDRGGQAHPAGSDFFSEIGHFDAYMAEMWPAGTRPINDLSTVTA
jgi:uncharacterized protein YcbK (DUF882 family)